MKPLMIIMLLLANQAWGRAEMAVGFLKLASDSQKSCSATVDPKAFSPCATCHGPNGESGANLWLKPVVGSDDAALQASLLELLTEQADVPYVSPLDNYLVAKIDPKVELGHGGGKEFSEQQIQRVVAAISSLDSSGCISQDYFTVQDGPATDLVVRGRRTLSYTPLRQRLLSLLSDPSPLEDVLNAYHKRLGWSNYTAKLHSRLDEVPTAFAYLDQVLGKTCELVGLEMRGQASDREEQELLLTKFATKALGIIRLEAAAAVSDILGRTRQNPELTMDQANTAVCYTLLRSPRFILR